MRLTAVMLKKDARRAVQLGNNDPFRTIDDEGTISRHQRDFPHVDFLLLDLLDRIRRLTIHDHQADTGPQRCRKGKSALLTLDDVKRWLAEVVADEFQTGVAGMRDDRENRGKRSLQAFVLAVGNCCIFLQEFAEGLQLRRQEVGHLENAGTFGEALADALLLGEGVGHGNSVRMKSVGKRACCRAAENDKQANANRLSIHWDRKPGFAFAGWRLFSCVMIRLPFVGYRQKRAGGSATSPQLPKLT